MSTTVKLTSEELAETAQLLTNATVDTDQSFTIDIGAANHVDLLISVGKPGGASTIQFFVDVLEPVSGSVVATYDGVQLVAAGTDYISIDGGSVVLGDEIAVRATVTGSFPDVCARLVVKPYA